MANYLTFPSPSDYEDFSVTVNGASVTSPYTLKNGDNIVAVLYNADGFNPETDTARTVFSLNGEEISSLDNALSREVKDDDVAIALVDDYWKGRFTLNVSYSETMISLKCSASSGVVLATEGKYCNTNVKVKPTLEEITITPGSSKQTVSPSEGYAGIGTVTVSKVSTQTKTVTPTKSSQSITPSSGKYFSKVTVKAIPDDYIIPSGTKEILENGTYDVTDTASVNVNVTVPTYDFETYVGGGFSLSYQDSAPDIVIDPSNMLEYYDDGGVLEFTALAAGVCTVTESYGYLGEGVYETSTEYKVRITETEYSEEKANDGIVTRALTSYSNSRIESVGTGAFAGCTALTSVELSKVTSIAEKAFADAAVLNKLILRSTTVCTLANPNAFENTPIASGSGYVYVSDALVDSYKSANNWQTYASQIKSVGELT